ncbi:hypothetical protein P8452_76624 [Trifolium repens]|nr:hypothetical protein P8452_76624 [Trifolium repens]
MAEKKTMRDYIMGNQERTAPKRKTLGEYIIESKLDAMIRQLETLMPSVCECCGLVGHKSQDCQIANSCDDYDILPTEEQNDPHSFKRDINYIPPCLRRTYPKQAEEPNINETRTTLRQSTITELFQRYQDSISTHIQPKFEAEAEDNLLTSGVDLNEDLTHETQVLIESEEALTEESNCEENDLVVLDKKERPKTPVISGQTLLTIGDVVIEVLKGKVNLRCGKEKDVLKALNSVENFSHFISSSFDNVVVTNYFSDLRMQVPMEKNYILQDPSIVANVIDEAIESVCALLSHNQLGREWTPYHMYKKFMEFLPNQRKQKDDVVYVSFWPP